MDAATLLRVRRLDGCSNPCCCGACSCSQHSIQISKLLQCGDTVTKPVKHSRYMTIHLLSHRTWTHGGPCAPKFELNRLDQGVDIGTFTGKAQLECKPQQ